MGSQGLFITLEGGECCGKGTQIKLLVESLKELYPDKEIVSVFDPGCTVMGTEIRRLVKNIGGDDAPTCFCELFLFSAARVQLVEKIIKPNIEKGNIVISDRFIDSTTVYQGKMNKNSLEDIEKINGIIGCYPDLTFVLNIGEDVFLERMSKRKGDAFDRYDTKSVDFHRKVYQEYRDLVNDIEDRNIFLVDSENSPEEVNELLLDLTRMYIEI